MHEEVVARKYATALFNLSLKQSQVDRIAQDFEELLVTFGRDEPKMPSLSSFLGAPQITDESKRHVLDKALKGNISDLALRFIHLLLEKNRLDLWRTIASEFDRLVNEWRGVVKARIITAEPLDEIQADELRARLEKKSGKKVTLVEERDPSILGGVIVIVGDKIIDGSLRFRLDSLKTELLAAKVN